MIYNISRIALYIAALGIAPSYAQEDSLEARRAAAERYFRLVPMKSVWEEAIPEVAKSLPESDRAGFIRVAKSTDVSRLESAARESFARHMSVKEINAFVAFMELPEGQSAMKKMKFYMADLMPVLQAELRNAIDQAIEKENPNQPVNQPGSQDVPNG